MWLIKTVCVLSLITLIGANYYEDVYLGGESTTEFSDKSTFLKIIANDEINTNDATVSRGADSDEETTGIVFQETITDKIAKTTMTEDITLDEINTTYPPRTLTTSLLIEKTLNKTERTTIMNTLIPLHALREEPNLDSETTTDIFYLRNSKIMKLWDKYNFNISSLITMITGLRSEFEHDLSDKLNETLHNMSFPTCPPPTTTTLAPTTSDYDANYTGSVVAKTCGEQFGAHYNYNSELYSIHQCYVCGLKVERIPINATCADAFAGDFLPLVPVDPTARAQVSKYRRYCIFENRRKYVLNDTTMPRTIFGRWTGGCAVRWIDLSGIYTQRVCRNRLKPIVGKHFLSKRMAKLEKSLWRMDDGCIVSPMATLVPFSRGVSLYARFHVCVCTGSWCNRAMERKKVNSIIGLLVTMLSILFG